MTNEEIRENILLDAMAELKTKATEVVGSIMSDLYAEYLPHVVSDTESNISYRVEGCLRSIIGGKIERSNENMAWVDDGYGNNHLINLGAYSVTLKPLCDLMGETIQTGRIKQLEDEIVLLRQQLANAYANR